AETEPQPVAHPAAQEVVRATIAEAPSEPSRGAEAPGGGTPAPGGAATRPADTRPPSRPDTAGAGKVLSPVVRRLLAEHNLNPDQIQGTGAGGRITRADVLAVVDLQRSGQPVQGAPAGAPSAAPSAPARPAEAPAQPAPAAAARAAAAPARPAPAPAARAGERDEVIPFSNIRRRTAEHMVRSKATSAHTLVVVEVDYHGVDKVRKSQGERFRAEEGVGLNYLPFISRAVIDAIREYPHVNASVGDDQLVVH